MTKAGGTLARTLLALLGVLALVAEAAAFEGFPPGKWWKNRELADQLKLSSAQVTEIEKLFVEERTRLIDLRAEAEKRELELEALLEAPALDLPRVEASIDGVNEARGALSKARLLMQVRVWQVLNPEQRRQIRAWQEERRPRKPERPGGPPGRPGRSWRPGPPHAAIDDDPPGGRLRPDIRWPPAPLPGRFPGRLSWERAGEAA